MPIVRGLAFYTGDSQRGVTQARPIQYTGISNRYE
jgi:hypothetical protein